ncbi:hypothetical protein THTE_0922 [Thermogutta terrifontis]|uniref:Ice-binding protein C-terminal domain-containing protein n=1 Tax=Thermogutta terrifontis TaxID=1331910 RepID=A0A286RC37_9BACT|nr:PEP-CTERM sorting domain-containing protein [Thermogutta terrifontis]ASV73524.1 hypothetical protein THTE_0922 [Thermogutta terrifontis]
MLRRLCWVLSLGVVVCGLSGSAFAYFGRPDWIGNVQFGGSGIVGSNSKLVWTELDLDGNNEADVFLALMAHGRYGQSPVYAVAPGIYYVETGKYGGTGYDKDYAKWNFGFYVAAPNVNQYLGVKLFYDFDPGENTGTLNYAWLIANFSQILDGDDDGNSNTPNGEGQDDQVAGEVENSWNLAMNFLSIPQSSTNPPGGVVINQTDISFDPNKNGEYTFKLAVYPMTSLNLNPDTWGDPSGAIVMQVNAVPEPATLVGLASLGATGLGAVVLRRRKKA